MRRAAGDERGYAMAVTVTVLMLALLFSLVAVEHVITGTSSAARDDHERRAIAAADAGLRIAILHLDALDPDIDVALQRTIAVQQCVVGGGAGAPVPLGLVSVAAGAWCPPVTGDLGTGARYAATTGPAVSLAPPAGVLPGTYPVALSRRIVSVGRAGRVVRRLYGEVRLDGTVTVSVNLGVPVYSDLHLQPYRVVPGSIRECAGGGSDPAAPIASALPSPPDGRC